MYSQVAWRASRMMMVMRAAASGDSPNSSNKDLQNFSFVVREMSKTLNWVTSETPKDLNALSTDSPNVNASVKKRQLLSLR